MSVAVKQNSAAEWGSKRRPVAEDAGKHKMKTKQVKVTFRGRELSLPAGLRVKPVAPYPTQTRPQFWLDEFPGDIFPPNSIILHDATHYGVWLEECEVEP